MVYVCKSRCNVGCVYWFYTTMTTGGTDAPKISAFAGQCAYKTGFTEQAFSNSIYTVKQAARLWIVPIAVEREWVQIPGLSESHYWVFEKDSYSNSSTQFYA